MSCCIRENGGQREALLLFGRDNLLYDIRNGAYIEGSILETDNAHNRHMVQDVGEEGNVDRVTRVLDLGTARCRELLYPYTKHEITRAVLEDRLEEQPVYCIALNVPDGFSHTTLVYLERLIHEYLVCRALADWMSVTNPGKAETWAVKAAEAESEIRSCAQTRMGRIRRKLHPF